MLCETDLVGGPDLPQMEAGKRPAWSQRLHRRFGDEGDRHPSFQNPRVVVFLDAGHTEKPVGRYKLIRDEW